MSFYRVSLGGDGTLDLGLFFLSFREGVNLPALLVEGDNGIDSQFVVAGQDYHGFVGVLA